MLIDFSPVHAGEMQLLVFSQRFSKDDLRAATNTYYDQIREIIDATDDSGIVFVPDDPDADDPYVEDPAERYIGWTLAHQVVHVTASQEENAGFSSLLARGIPAGGRLRYETHWRTITTKTQAIQRLEESRRLCLAYLEAWPDEPLLDVYRESSANALARSGYLNAPAIYLAGLKHTDGHMAQFRETLRQAQAARLVVAAAGD
jgi:hypothetical protein